MSKTKRKIDWPFAISEFERIGYESSMEPDGKTDVTGELFNEYVVIRTVNQQVVISAHGVEGAKYFKPAMLSMEAMDTANLMAFANIYSEFIRTADMSHAQARATA